MSIQVVPAIDATVGEFVMVEWDKGTMTMDITLGGGFDEKQKVRSAALLRKAADELEGRE